jgi:ankyrin repeat protein
LVVCWFASRSVAAIQALLNRGVVVNQLRGISNFTPLHAIASRGNSHSKPVVQEVVKMLVNVCGVDLEAPTSLGRTCTHVAACTREDPSSHYALRCFIDAGADVNNVDHAAHTPLHLVSDYKCTVLLLAAGANVNARDRQGRTAFDLAVSRRSASLLPVFVAAGAETELSVAPLDADRVETARREIAKTRLDLVRERALHVCVGLQSLSLDALQVCEILQHACGPVAHLIAFHHWWTIATTVKHFNAPKTN